MVKRQPTFGNEITLFGKKYYHDYIAKIIFTKSDEIFSGESYGSSSKYSDDFISYPYFTGNSKSQTGIKFRTDRESIITFTPNYQGGYIDIWSGIQEGFDEIHRSIELALLNDLSLPHPELSISYTSSKGVHVRPEDIEIFITNNNIDIDEGLKNDDPLGFGIKMI